VSTASRFGQKAVRGNAASAKPEELKTDRGKFTAVFRTYVVCKVGKQVKSFDMEKRRNF
jgi:hypothetical protein